MNEIDVFSKLEEITAVTQFGDVFGDDTEKAKQIADHKNWLRNIRHERPNVTHPFKVGVYIRYFNQTKYENYLSYHKKQFQDSIALCPKWEFVDFYVDNGASPPYMENAPAWSSLMEGLLATQVHPVGIYFISEDIFTLASYYLEDLRDIEFFPSPDWTPLPDEVERDRLLHD